MRGSCKMKRLTSVVVLMALATTCQAVVLHADGAPDDKPGNGVVGRWDGNASCVVVGPEWIITTAHQGGGVGTAVTVDGVQYVVSEVYDSGDDLIVARIETPGGAPAELLDFADLSWESESLAGMDVVFGGYGKGRGNGLYSAGMLYGYLWEGSANTEFRWGTNVIDAIYGKIIVADFDGAGHPEATACAAALAAWDSGGGWFVLNDETGRWEVVGLSVSTDRYGESRFNNRTDPTIDDPDRVFAISVGLSADWIADIMAGNAPPEDPELLRLSVVRGTGSGDYEAGTVVPIAAQVPNGYTFVEWTGDTETVIDVTAPETFVVVEDDCLVLAVVELVETLVVSAWLDREWTYQNAPVNAQNNHGVVLMISVEDDPEGADAYAARVTQTGGPGTVVIEPTDDPLVWIIKGGRVGEDPVGEVALTVSVEGRDVRAVGSTSCTLKVRMLGDTDGNGGVEAVDAIGLILALNGVPPAGIEPEAFDLDADGFVEPADLSVLMNVLNGQPIL